MRLNRIVNEVLDFARPIRFRLRRRPTSTRSAATPADGGVAPAATARSSSRPRRRRLPVIVTDAERLRMALVNLLVNARHAVDGAGGRRTACDA